MISLLFATNNIHKASEINAILGDRFSILSLAEKGIDIDIPEPYETIKENAVEKARVIFELTKLPCFGEDTGLEIDALDGRPGVKSARYAGEGRSSMENIRKVLEEMKDTLNRKARFRTVICLITDSQPVIFEGICEGTIIASLKGESGFGYDPIFVPDGAEKTFAEMNMKEKNNFSHRRKAVDKLISYLTSNRD